jgi:hypothetical protein
MKPWLRPAYTHSLMVASRVSKRPVKVEDLAERHNHGFVEIVIL